MKVLRTGAILILLSVMLVVAAEPSAGAAACKSLSSLPW